MVAQIFDGPTTTDGDQGPVLVGQWTFEEGEELIDKQGNFGPLILKGAIPIDGALDVGNQRWANLTNYTGPDLTSKTLVSWVRLDNLDVRSGSALTIDHTNKDVFDGLVYAELASRKWATGSNNLARSKAPNPGFVETETGILVQLVATYEQLSSGAVVNLYRNGEFIARNTAASLPTYAAGSNIEVVFGTRHTSPITFATNQFIDGQIEEARIYKGVLSPEDVAELFEEGVDPVADTDEDGIPDDADNCPTVANADQNNNDGDALGDACDDDDDNDGVLDVNDAFPFDENESLDTDGDGIGNKADTDDDGDGQTDADELACGSDPLDAASLSPDNDGDTIPDCTDPDDDNDGFDDDEDCSPFNAAVNPLAAEICDGIDNNCDGVIDENVAPVITVISVTTDPTALGGSTALRADFTDGNDQDGHAAVVDWGDGTSATLTVDQSGNFATGTHRYAATGVYAPTVTITDACGDSDTETSTTYAVIFDPGEGFVTGGGWIDSPLGAYAPDPALTGKANFGFVAKYKKGQSTPDGNTTFHLNAASFKFNSTAYEWLVVAGNRAKFKGIGEVNGTPGFGFMITGIDGDMNKTGEPDKFRIKIWSLTDGSVVYDNQRGQSDTEYATTELAGGKIQIHKGGSSKPSGKSKDVSNGEELTIPATLAAYPNPAAYEVTVSLEGWAGDTEVVLLDQLGRRVITRTYPAGTVLGRLDLRAAGIQSGVYTLSASDGTQRVAHRLVIQR